MKHCYLFPPPRQPVFIQLGRFGDLLIVFPGFKAIFDRTGLKPIVLVSSEYAGLFDGISYANPWVLQLHWWRGLGEARRLALEHFGDEAIIPQWWNEGRDAKDIPRGVTVLQCHGMAWGVDVAKWPNFNTSMWDRAGFDLKEMQSLPLVFDRRNHKFEQQVVQRYVNPRRPLLLVNFTGMSSPFAFTPEVMRVLYHWRSHFQILDIGQIRLPHIYDLLGLYDRAAGLITIDTATAHLAPASRVPSVWFTVDGWTSSVPRGNAVLEIKYGQTRERLGDLNEVIKRWSENPTHEHPSPVHGVPDLRPGDATAQPAGPINVARSALA